MRQNTQKGRSGFTLIELLVVVAIIALLISILLPSLARARELAKRTTCAANLNGMGKGLYAYASEGNQGMPISAHAAPTQEQTGSVSYVQSGGSKRGRRGFPTDGEINLPPGTGTTPGTQISTVRNLWTLVRLSGSTPGSFTCPSSEDVKNDEDSPQDYWDFGIGDVTTEVTTERQEANKQCSYGYQVPYGQLGKPTADGDQRSVLAADKGPFGVQPESGSGTHPGDPVGLDTSSSSDDWRKFNSPNHGGIGDGEGQNVLYADSHAEWAGKPTAGPGQDNIYTRYSTAGTSAQTPAARFLGNGPSTSLRNLTPWGITDGLIYP